MLTGSGDGIIEEDVAYMAGQFFEEFLVNLVLNEGNVGWD